MPRNNRPETPRADRFADATAEQAGRPPTRRPAALRGGQHEVRIIGGEWRGRKLHFTPAAGLRPTPDRVRETLFNWLQFELAGTRCLDLFAGSGALGFEALSRGAAEAVFVERDPVSARAIGDMLARLRCERGRVERVDALAWLERGPLSPQPFDIVFLDPPYDEACLPVLTAQLERGGWLAPGGWVYLEDAAARGEPTLPTGWTLLRSKRAGDVGYHLARRGVPAPENNRQARGSK